jgi:hypothetical protein
LVVTTLQGLLDRLCLPYIAHCHLLSVRYTGKDKSRLVTNMLFRMGASAVLMSNKPAWASRAKYTLHKAVRVHTAAVEESYK